MSTAAFANDEAAYQRLVEPHRRELHAHCYRMLGSVQDAEDALQDALLRAWEALDRFEGRSSPRSWLYRIATNTCLDALARRPASAMLPIDRDAGRARRSTETVWLEPYPGRSRTPSLRAARERRAGVHRRAPAPAGQPARGADPARGARLLRQGGRGDPRHDAGLGQQRDAARPRGGRRAAARAVPAGDAALAGRRARSASWSSATSRRGTAATSTPWWRCSPRRRRSRCRRTSSGSAGARRSATFLPRGPAVDPAPLRAHARQRPARVRHLQADRRRVAAERDPRASRWTRRARSWTRSRSSTPPCSRASAPATRPTRECADVPIDGPVPSVSHEASSPLRRPVAPATSAGRAAASPRPLEPELRNGHLAPRAARRRPAVPPSRRYAVLARARAAGDRDAAGDHLARRRPARAGHVRRCTACARRSTRSWAARTRSARCSTPRPRATRRYASGWRRSCPRAGWRSRATTC